MPPQTADSLERFVAAQAPVMAEMREELRRGKKQGHWMWFVFPQLRGLGMSETSRYYGIASLSEAKAYLAHAVLGPRLEECTGLVLQAPADGAEAIFGNPDTMKFRSSMTLFAQCEPGGSVYETALKRFFMGVADVRTLELLGER